TTELEVRTRELIEQARAATRRSELPPPLEDSPKCNGCSLNGICLPDETLALQRGEALRAEARAAEEVESAEAVEEATAIRRLFPARVSTVPLYVQEQGARIGKRGERLTVSKGDAELTTVRLKDISQLVLMGNIQIS